jgi:hypothetical protein
MADLDRLPRRFPVGTRYVVEGAPGADGEFSITSRMVVLPNGTELSLPPTPQGLAARMARRARLPARGRDDRKPSGRKAAKGKTMRA